MQLDMLTMMGCHEFQGYYFSKPVPVSEFEENVSGIAMMYIYYVYPIYIFRYCAKV